MTGEGAQATSITGVLARPRLLRVLDAPAVRVCVLHGPPGCGKTALVRTWRETRQDDDDRPVVWVSLDAAVRGRRSFWQRVLDAAARATGPARLPEGTAPAALDLDPFHAALHDLAAAGPLVLVVDAYQHLGEATGDVDADLLRLLRTLPDLRLVITTRATTALRDADPPGGITRVLTLSDLALTQQEMGALVTSQAGVADPGVVAAVTAATHGYALAVRALVLALAELGALPGVDSPEWGAVVAARLAPLLPADVPAQFVRDTCVPPYLDAELGAAVSEREDTARLLSQLERDGFGRWIPYSTTHRVFQYVATIRDVFRAGAREDAARFARTSVLTAQWLLEREEVVDLALGYAIDGGDYALADRIALAMLIGNPDSYTRPRYLATLQRVPESVLGEYPMLTFALALAFLTHPLLRRAGEQAATIASTSTARPSYVEPSIDAFVMASMQAISHRLARRFQKSARDCRSAIAVLDGIDPVLQAKCAEMLGSVLRQLSYSLFQGGDIDEALRVNDRAVALCRTQPARNFATVHAVGFNAFAGDMGRAQSAAAAVEPDLWPPGLANSYLCALGQIGEAYERLDALDFAGAADVLRDAAAYTLTTDLWPLFAAISVSARHGLGQAGAGATQVAEHLRDPLPPGVADNIATERLYAALALAWLSSGQTARAAEALASQRDPSPYTAAARVALAVAEGDAAGAVDLARTMLHLPDHTSRTRAELQTQGAVAALRADEDDLAWEWLSAAAIAWEDAGPRMHVALLSPPDRRLLRDLAEAREMVSAQRYLEVPVAAARASAPPGATLTRREQIVLTALAEHESIKAVADALVVSPHTVKSQLRSIYRKFGVSSAQAAVAVARELALL